MNKVVQWSGVPYDKPLTANSGTDIQKIVAAMSRVENGREALQNEVSSGFALQTNWKI